MEPYPQYPVDNPTVPFSMSIEPSTGGGGGAPEIDPAMGMGALAFLSGAILVIRGRVKAGGPH